MSTEALSAFGIFIVEYREAENVQRARLRKSKHFRSSEF
jgi:hypothetical protein